MSQLVHRIVGFKHIMCRCCLASSEMWSQGYFSNIRKSALNKNFKSFMFCYSIIVRFWYYMQCAIFNVWSYVLSFTNCCPSSWPGIIFHNYWCSCSMYCKVGICNLQCFKPLFNDKSSRYSHHIFDHLFYWNIHVIDVVFKTSPWILICQLLGTWNLFHWVYDK